MKSPPKSISPEPDNYRIRLLGLKSKREVHLRGGFKGKMKMFKKICVAAALATVINVGVAGDLVINGSTTVLPIVQKAAETFSKENPAITISLSGGGSGNGMKALVDGLATIAMSSRDIKESETKLAQTKGVVPVRTAVAVDAIVPVVSNANPVKNISMANLKAVYEGKIKNWKELGGADAPIVVVSRDSSSGTFETWESLVMKKARVTPRALLQTSNGTVVQTVAKNKNAIGYIGIGYVDGQTKPLTVDGKAASAQAAKDKTWPLSRELYFFTNGTPAGDAKVFVDWMIDPAKGQKAVKETGFVPLS